MGTEIGATNAHLIQPSPDDTSATSQIAGTSAEDLKKWTYSLLREELEDDACSFEFFQAVALLERMLVNRRPVGRFSSPEEEAVRFRVNLHLGFPASQVQELRINDDEPAEMMVNFMGLTGPQGVLPYAYSELILERHKAKDRSLASFFDIFNHRAISLFYRAWQRARFHVNYGVGARDHFSRYLRDLLGIGTDGLFDRQHVEDESLMHYVSLLGLQTRSATALEQVLADYFEVPVEVQQFTGTWYTLDRATQCAFTDKEGFSTQVGLGAVVGDAVWDRQGRARIRVGPLQLERYNEFLPGGEAHRAITSITRFFSNGCVDFELQLVLERSQVPFIELNSDSTHPARLGWVSWASTKSLTRDPDDTILAL